MDGGAWWAAVHVVAKSQTWLSDFPFTFHFHALEKEMATHSSVLAWRIPGTGEPDGLPSLGSHRVGHDWNDLAAAAADFALHIHRLCIHGFNQLWNLWMQRTHCTESLYIRDLSIHKGPGTNTLQISRDCHIVITHRQRLSNLSMHQNHLEGLWKHRFLDSSSQHFNPVTRSQICRYSGEHNLRSMDVGFQGVKS